MNKRLTPEDRRERRRRAVQRSKFALPSALTVISVFCGFSCVVMSINAAGDRPAGYFLWAAGLLVAATVFDGLDGRVARATNTTSEFGVQLDSLADVLSFGMAPAILAYRYGFFQLGLADPQLRYVGWAAGFFTTVPLTQIFGTVAVVTTVAAVVMFLLVRPMRGLMGGIR